MAGERLQKRLKRNLVRDEHIAFLQGFLRRPQQAASVVPSSRFLERRLVSLANIRSAQLVVELGPGTGGTTSALLAALPANARLLSKPITQWDEFTGRVAAVETVELRPRASGYVHKVAYLEGQEVRKGDLLFVIDPRPYRAALDRAEAELERARSEARLAHAQDARAQSLIEAKAISREDFETRRAAASGSDAAVRAAEAAVASARLDLQFTQVRSPIDGRAGRALVTEGNLAHADSTLLTTVVSQDPVFVYFESDEHSFLRYSELARTGERSRTSNAVRVGLANEAGYPHTGTVDFMDNQVDPRTGTIRARAVLRNPDMLFTPGLFARVQLEGSAEFKAMLIDDKAVLTDQDRRYVYIIGEKNSATRRDVTLGAHVEGLVVDGLRVSMSEQDFAKFPRSALIATEVTRRDIRNVVRLPEGGSQAPPVVR